MIASNSPYGGSGSPHASAHASPASTPQAAPAGMMMTASDFEATLSLYRTKAKKSNDPELLLEFARFLMQVAVAQDADKAQAYRREAYKMCKKAASTGHDEAQFLLAECYETGAYSDKNKPDYGKAFSLYSIAAKHSHPEAAYRAAVYYENGRGTSKSPPRALQFYQKAAALGHPGAMYRIGMAELHGELGMVVNPRNGTKWLKMAAAAATPEHPEALYELALLHETGIDHVVFVDYEYSVKLLREAAQLGHVMSMYRLGSYYEHGNHVAKSPQTSFSYFKAAAERGHPDSMFGVASWYLTGYSEAGVPQSDDQAFEWMKRAAESGLVKAFFALGYFYEEGIGTPGDPKLALEWYQRALAKGDKRAGPKISALKQVVAGSATMATLGRRRAQPAPPETENERERIRKARTGEDACVIM
ncbi:hypothetical protein GGF32_007108 [Allomyces javanicus]|nr:hypothetical protein GGF32_007108 [Allomyces javanicus]